MIAARDRETRPYVEGGGGTTRQVLDGNEVRWGRVDTTNTTRIRALRCWCGVGVRRFWREAGKSRGGKAKTILETYSAKKEKKSRVRGVRFTRTRS